MDIVIVGGGMSGMVGAIALRRLGHHVILIEQHSRLGKKVSVTGNGRCNISNANIATVNYNKGALVNTVLSHVDQGAVYDFLTSVDIFTYTDSMGRLYPITDNSNSVVDCLRIAIDRLGIEVILDTVVKNIARGERYTITTNNGIIRADRVVLAVGSGSGTTHTNVQYLTGKYLTPLVPSLVPVATANADKTLNGIRAKVNATLVANGEEIYTNSGEVLFKDYGLSGICIFDMSSIIADNIKQGVMQDYTIQLDLLPSINTQQLIDIIYARLRANTPTEQLLLGLLHNKLACSCINRSGKRIATVQYATTLANAIKCHEHTVARLLDFSKSQVTCGGIAEKYLTPDMALPSGVYCIGEVLDVNGMCGGYNLHFAISSALYVSSCIGDAYE